MRTTQASDFSEKPASRGTSEHSSLNPRLILGALLAVAGTVVLLERSGLLQPGFAASWWPTGLAGVGFLQLVFADNRPARVLGLFLALLGAALLLANLDPGLLDYHTIWGVAGPVGLIGAGGYLVYRAIFPASHREADDVSVLAVLSGQEQKLGSRAFRGGQLTAVMGGFELDLRDADIAPGEEAVLDVLTLMGGGVVRVPKEWSVENRITPCLGGVSVKLDAPERQDYLAAGPDKRLRIDGLALMGGIEIRN